MLKLTRVVIETRIQYTVLIINCVAWTRGNNLAHVSRLTKWTLWSEASFTGPLIDLPGKRCEALEMLIKAKF